MWNWLPQAIKIAYEFSNEVVFSLKFCVHASVCKPYKCLGCCWKGEQIDEDHWEAWMSAAACLQLSQHACACVMCCSMPAWVSGGLSLIAWLTAAAFHAHEYTHSSTGSKTLFKKLPSLRQTEWHACHLSLPLSEPRPSSGVIWWRHAPRASVRHRVTPHRAWLRPGSRSGLEAASAVRCCKWLSELTDRSPSVPAALNPQDQSAYLDPLCALCVYVVWMYLVCEGISKFISVDCVAIIDGGPPFPFCFLPSVPSFHEISWCVTKTQVVSS